MSKATRGERLADAMFNIESPIVEARDKANALQCFCELTIVRTGHALSREQADAFVHMIGDVFDANRKLLEAWSAEWEAATGQTGGAS